MAVGHQVASSDMYPLFPGSDLPVLNSSFLGCDGVIARGRPVEVVDVCPVVSLQVAFLVWKFTSLSLYVQLDEHPSEHDDPEHSATCCGKYRVTHHMIDLRFVDNLVKCSVGWWADL